MITAIVILFVACVLLLIMAWAFREQRNYWMARSREFLKDGNVHRHRNAKLISSPCHYCGALPKEAP